MLKLNILALLTLFVHIYSIRRHNCIHDELIEKHNIKLTRIDDFHEGRNLQANGFGPIRIHYVYNTTDISQTDTLGQNVIKIMEIIRSFWEKII